MILDSMFFGEHLELTRSKSHETIALLHKIHNTLP